MSFDEILGYLYKRDFKFGIVSLDKNEIGFGWEILGKKWLFLVYKENMILIYFLNI